MALILGFSALVGVRLSFVNIATSEALLLYIAQVCIAAGGFAMNDVLDYNRDVGVSSKPIPTGRISRDVARRTSTSLILIGIVVAASLSGSLALFAGGQCLLVWLYSGLKMRSGAIANWVTAALCASSFMFGCYYVGSIGLSWFPILLTIEIIVARELVKDVLDHDVDQAAGVITVPIKYGLRRTHALVFAVVFAAFCTVLLTTLVKAHHNLLHVTIISGLVIILLFTLARFPLYSVNRVRQHAGLFLNISALCFLFAIVTFWHMGK